MSKKAKRRSFSFRRALGGLKAGTLTGTEKAVLVHAGVTVRRRRTKRPKGSA